MAMVTLKVYDILGKEVSTLVNEYQQAGTFDVVFDGSNLASGVYYYQLTTGELTCNKEADAYKIIRFLIL